MPRKATVRLNHAGMAALARSEEMQKLCRYAADRIAGHVTAQNIRVGDHDGGSREVPLPVKVTERVTDRAVASVLLAHPSGVAVQAKHGVLTRAAAAEGLTVKSGSQTRLVNYTSAAGRVSTITLAQALNYGGSYVEL